MGERPQDLPPTPAGGYFIPYPTVSRPAGGEIGLGDLFERLKAGRTRIVVITALCTAIAVAVASLMTPVYRAEVLLSPVSDERTGGAASALSGQLGGLASLAGFSISNGSTGKEEAIATLQSRALIDLYVKEHDLLPVLFDDDWDANAGRWKSSDPRDVPTQWDAYKLIEKRVRQVSVDKKTGLVTLAVEWKDPELAARWAGGLVRRANAYLRAQAVRSAENNLAYLQEQARKTSSVELQQAIYRLMENEVKKAMLANVADEFAFKVIDPAVVPEERESPKRVRIALLGMLIGLFVGVAAVLGKTKDFAKDIRI